MASRMEKYQQTDTQLPKRRLEKNQEIYDDFYKNTTYTEFAKVNTSDVIELEQVKNNMKSREVYRKTRHFEGVLPSPVLEEPVIQEMKTLSLPSDEAKIYDINQVLESAKEHRESFDSLEKKRKLRNTEYNILEGLNQEKIQELKEKRKEALKEDEEQGLEELIHTITSNSLKKKIEEKMDQDLLSDLMPEREDETIITEAISKDILEDYAERVPAKVEEKEEIDHSFYTRSMDLSDQDFELLDTSFAEPQSKKLFIKVLCVVIVLVIISISAYLIYKKAM